MAEPKDSSAPPAAAPPAPSVRAESGEAWPGEAEGLWRQRATYTGAAILSVAWLALCLSYVDRAVGWGNLFQLPTGDFGGIASV